MQTLPGVECWVGLIGGSLGLSSCVSLLSVSDSLTTSLLYWPHCPQKG